MGLAGGAQADAVLERMAKASVLSPFLGQMRLSAPCGVQ